MSAWTIRRDEPYENSEEQDYPDAQSAYDALKQMSEWYRRYVEIFPAIETSYEPREFEKAFERGRIDVTKWGPLNLDNPPHNVMVGLSDDGCSVCVLVRLDDGTWVHAEDGEIAHFISEYPWWIPAAPEFHPHFMNITQDDWY